MAQLVIPNGDNNPKVEVGGSRDHSKLRNLDFASSGHSGFQPTLTFDNAPTSGSGNPVTSGGVYSADKSIKDDINNIYTAPVSFSPTYNSTTVYYYVFIPGVSYSITPTKACGRIEIRNGETTYSSLNWATVAANTTKTFTAPANATNVKVSYPGSGCSVTIKRTDTVISAIEANISALGTSVSAIETRVDKIYISASYTGTANSTQTNVFAFIPGHSYRVDAVVQLDAVRIQDSAGNNISGYAWTSISAGSSIVFSAPSNAAKIYIGFHNAGTITMTDTTAVLGNVQNTVENAKIANLFTGKTMAVCGDSICKGSYATTPWHTIVKNRYGLASVQNLAQDGSRYGVQGTYDRITLQVQSVDPGTDIIAVFAGTNDYAFDSALGTRADAASGADGASFYAAVKYTMEYLVDNFPTSKIIYLTPLQRNDSGTYDSANSQGLRLSDYVNVIRELAEVYGIILCDVYRNSEFHVFDSTFKTDYTGGEGGAHDGLHPNEAGTALYTKNAIIPVFDRVLLGWEASVKALMK